MMTQSTFFHATAIVLLVAMVISLYRVVVGPAVIDRIIGANVIGTKTIAVILVTGFIFDRVEFFIDIAILYALIYFMGTLALSRYFERKGLHHDFDGDAE